MLKMKKVMAIVLATLLSGSAIATTGFTGKAEEEFALGDVDMDGVITGHDSAMVSRCLHVDPEMLTDEQLVLADVNEDGVVDQSDADWIHENEVYAIGDVFGDGEVTALTAWYELNVYAEEQVGDMIVVNNGVTEVETVPEGGTLKDISWIAADGDTWETRQSWEMDQLVYNLFDADGDEKLTAIDSLSLLTIYAETMVHCEIYVNGRYDILGSNYDNIAGYESAKACAEHDTELAITVRNYDEGSYWDNIEDVEDELMCNSSCQ